MGRPTWPTGRSRPPRGSTRWPTSSTARSAARRSCARLLLLAQERFERDDDELRSLARQFEDDLRRESERRKAAEARLDRIRRSLPGRLFLTLRAIWSIGRR